MPTTVTASQFQQAFGLFTAKALQEPVTITKHGRPQLVVVSAEEWSRLKRRDRRSGMIEDMPEDLVQGVLSAKVPEEFADLDDLLK